MTRAVSTPLGAVVLALVTVVLAALVGAGALGIAADADVSTGASVALSAEATADGTVRLVHEGGTSLDATDLRVRVQVDGEPLDRQPPVPFFAAPGFHGGPTGPFNPAADPTWEVGERAGFRVAGTNAPALEPGRTVTVELYSGETPVGTAETTVRPA